MHQLVKRWASTLAGITLTLALLQGCRRSPAQWRNIFRAAAGGDLSAVQGFVKRNPSLINAAEADGSRPLDLAIVCGHPRTAEWLFLHGASINPNLKSSAARYAASYGEKGLVRFMVRHGAKEDFFSAAAVGDLAFLQGELQHNPRIVNMTDDGLSVAEGGYTAIDYAMFGCVSVRSLKWLVMHGADPNADPGALLLGLRQMRFEAVVMLVRAGADPNPVITIGGKTGHLLTLTRREYQDYFHHYLRGRIIRWYLKKATARWDAERRAGRHSHRSAGHYGHGGAQ